MSSNFIFKFKIEFFAGLVSATSTTPTLNSPTNTDTMASVASPQSPTATATSIFATSTGKSIEHVIIIENQQHELFELKVNYLL